MQILIITSALTACIAGLALATAAQEPPRLPWQREAKLWDAAQSVEITGTLNPTDPNSRSGVSINNLKMHTAIWGPPNRVTISITKNNVWDRRLHMFHAPTLEEMTEGAFSPLNRDYVGVKEIDPTTFAIVDIVDLPTMAAKLNAKSNAVSDYLSPRLDDKTRAALAAYLSDKTYEAGRVLLTNLVVSLNAVTFGPALYNKKPFQELTLRPETADFAKRNPQGSDRARLNRLLLEDAYPKEISRKEANSLRPLDLGWLRKEGGSYDPYRYPIRYAFPCLKPVGQIILGMDPLAAAPAPQVTQRCANGVTTLQITNGNAKATLAYVLEIAHDVYAIRANFDRITTPIWLRLYRHRDTSHLHWSAVLRMPCWTAICRTSTVCLVTTKYFPLRSSSAIGATTRTCGNRLWITGCLEGSKMPGTGSTCRACC